MTVPSSFLCKRLGVNLEQLFFYSITCPRRYKHYQIDKRNGGKRKISQPAKNLKIVQRILLNEFFKPKMKIHSSATAYRTNRSISDNVRPHLDNGFLLKMDFTNFFPSIKATDFQNYLIKNKVIDKEMKEELKLVSNIFFMWFERNLVLSIGAPSSPLISNALMYEFDTQVSNLAEERGVAYTRYSDDLSFSTNAKDVLFDFPDLIAGILNTIESPRITLNEDKTVFTSKKHNRHITGITISNDGKASLGRERKRELRSRVFSTSKVQLAPKELAKLKGHLAFAHSVEPEFVEKLYKKYPDQMKLLKPRNTIKD